jgi:lipid II:glycine glycyltransferase (peptidoglycan interpeptide bridge formation enzyme)
MTLTITIPSPGDWDVFVRAQPNACVLQLSAWGALKSAFGWRATRVGLERDGQLVGGAQVLFRPLARGLLSMAYVPYGGYAPWDVQADFVRALRQSVAGQRAAFLKWEPGLYLDAPAPDPSALGFVASPQTIQPPRTIVLDITGDEDAIMARMNQGTRRKIRQSQKSGLRYFEGSAADVPRFSALMDTTGARNQFGVHSEAYYAKAFALLIPRDGALMLAESEDGELLAGVFVTAVDGSPRAVAAYLYGASSDAQRDKQASYGVQWAAIQWAKARGCAWYDLWGIPDAEPDLLEAEFQARSDGLWGVYGFKRGWGGQVVRAVGAWDLPLMPPAYWAYKQLISHRGG